MRILSNCFFSEERIGLFKFKELDNKIEILQLQIHPDFQGKGLGQKVMEQILSSYKFKIVELAVLKSNPAKKFYERLGFVVTGKDEYEFHMQVKH